jgi:hypothetical protein
VGLETRLLALAEHDAQLRTHLLDLCRVCHKPGHYASKCPEGKVAKKVVPEKVISKPQPVKAKVRWDESQSRWQLHLRATGKRAQFVIVKQQAADGGGWAVKRARAAAPLSTWADFAEAKADGRKRAEAEARPARAYRA